jgi:lipopolysaccharide transport system ATP-binding protein
MPTAIRIDNLSKLYRLGTIGTGTISHDLNRWWHRLRGKEDPYAKIGQVNDRTGKSSITSRLPSVATATQDSRIQTGDVDSPASGKRKTESTPGSDYVWALRDINLEVAQGEILGIIGRNGAGKSTLLKLLSRVTAPTTGSIRTRGRIASLLEVGTGFHPELTGRENIYLNGAILGMKRHEITRRLDEIVDFSGCGKYLDTPVKRYSSGMMVRLGFAVAAHLDCEILIVDEVLAVGDAEFQKKCIGKMRDISRGSGRTVLFVSHNMPSIEQLCTRAVLIGSGGVQIDGSVDDVVAAYLASNHYRNNYDLSRRAEELPDHAVVLTGARCTGLENSEHKPISIFEDWVVTLKFLVRRTIIRPEIAIAIESENGTRVSRVRTSDTGGTFPTLAPGVMSLRCHIQNLNLVAGHYNLLAGVAESGGALLDYVANAAQVEVIARGHRGITSQHDHSRSLCFFVSDWSIPDSSGTSESDSQ